MKRVQWGFSTIGCPELSLKEASELGKKYGYPLVEVRVRGTDFAEKELLLEEDEFFVLGDNRNQSEDSRFANIGNITRDEIIGKAWITLNPFDIISLKNLKQEEETEE